MFSRRGNKEADQGDAAAAALNLRRGVTNDGFNDVVARIAEQRENDAIFRASRATAPRRQASVPAVRRSEWRADGVGIDFVGVFFSIPKQTTTHF